MLWYFCCIDGVYICSLFVEGKIVSGDYVIFLWIIVMLFMFGYYDVCFWYGVFLLLIISLNFLILSC